MRILGLDPGFSDGGWCVADIDKDLTVKLLDAGHWSTEKDKLAKSVSSDNMRRAALINGYFQDVDNAYGPFDFVMTEAQSWPRNASATSKVAMWWGILSSLVYHDPSLQLFQCTPKQIKICMSGGVSATKAQVADSLVLREQYSNILELLSHIGSKANRAHPIDAAAAICTVIENNEAEVRKWLNGTSSQ